MLDAPDDPLARAWDALDARQRDAVDEVFSDLGKALAAFERRIVSRDSAFDRFVAALVDGDSAGVESYPPDALRGLSLFVGEARCHVCHSGPNFSDREFHATRLPVSAELPTDLGRFKGRMAVRADPFNGLGRFADGADADTRAKLEHTPPTGHVWGEFKTPTLRNAARTAPYMHQGQLATLRAVIEFYSDEVPPPHPQEGERVLAPLFLDEGETARPRGVPRDAGRHAESPTSYARRRRGPTDSPSKTGAGRYCRWTQTASDGARRFAPDCTFVTRNSM